MRMRICTLSLLLLFFGYHAQSQLPDGAPAPDFSVDLISKVSPTAPPVGGFSLSAETSQGRGVCLVFSATWCGPCWSFHNSGVLETVYNQYGPGGTGDASVLFIEADTRTNRECMFNAPGCNFGNSQGNWMNVSFGMTDLDANNGPNVAGDYAVSAYPTLYVVSPDMRAYQIRQRTLPEYESWLLHSFKLDATATVQDAVCGGDGSVTLNVTGGYQTLKYDWSNGAKTKDLNGVSGGSYTVTITDANDYDLEFGPFNVGGPTSPLEVQTVILDHLRCNDVPEGQITVSGVGGTPGYNYQWSNGEVGNEINLLLAGQYIVTITDGVGCESMKSYIVNEPPPLVLNYGTYPETCEDENGVIEGFALGGTPPHKYSIGGPATYVNTFSNLRADVYTLTTIDLNGCSLQESVEVEGIPSPIANAGDDGVLGCGVDSIMLDATESTSGPDIAYLWTTTNGHILRGETGLTPEVDSPGIYTLRVTDTNVGCVSEDQVEVTDEGDVVARPGRDTSLTCDVVEIHLDGSASTQRDHVIYQWTTLDGYIAEGDTTLMPLVRTVGTYRLVATDTLSGCTDTAAVDVYRDDMAPLIVLAPVKTLTCEVLEVEIDATGSSQGPMFIYEWSTLDGEIVSGGNTLKPTVNKPGVYSLTITNTENGCMQFMSVLILQKIDIPAADFHANKNYLIVQFEDKSTGNPDSRAWDFGDGGTSTEAGPTHEYAEPGDYTVCLRVENACDESTLCMDIQVRSGTPLTLTTYALNNISCWDGADGSIDVSVEGGLAPYTYLWSTGSTEKDLVDVPAGRYSLTVTDADSSQTVEVFELTQPDSLEIEDVVIEHELDGNAQGSISFEVKGGVPPYSYAWSNGDTAAHVGGLSAGTYYCTVTDDNGCEREFGPFEVGMVSGQRGIAQLNLFEVTPNPSRDYVTVRLEFAHSADRIMRISDLNGRILAMWSMDGVEFERRVEVAGYPAGMYSVQVFDGTGAAQKWLVVQK
jgi:PKD repeat protein